MNVGFDLINNKLVIRIDGDIDHHTCEEIRNKIDNEIMRRNPKSIIFDMKNVNFMDSSGIGVIIGRYKLIVVNNGITAMVNVKPQIKRVYDICGLKKIIPIYENENMAVKNI
ncbi:MAG: anti-sigma F factor antagonist [Clostridiales bacterium GWB2_37_7]|nr:MAG: anti-sigma F factor antagonist [Clostridiales bacterium GWB2_37_7]